MTAAVPQYDRRLAIAALIAVNALWGTSFPIVRSLNLEMDQHFQVVTDASSGWFRAASAGWLIASRFGLALALLIFFAHRLCRRVKAPHFWSGVAIGTFFFAGIVLQVIALATIPASRSGFLTSLAVVFTPLLAACLGRKWPRLNVLGAAMVALLGVAILAGMLRWSEGKPTISDDAMQHWTLGDGLTTLAAILFSIQILLLDGLGKRYDSAIFTPSMFLTTFVLGCLCFLIAAPRIPENLPETWVGIGLQSRYYLLIIWMSVFGTLLAFTWMNKYQPAVSAGQAAVIYTVEPLFASAWAMFLPGWFSVLCGIAYVDESLTASMLVGGLFILLANLLALWPSTADQGR